MQSVSVIVATTPKRGIGRDGKLPWRLPGDMAHFKRVTTALPAGSDKRNAVIMGRKTWESIPEKFRPLPERVNVVLTSMAADPTFNGVRDLGVLVLPSVAAAVEQLSARGDIEEIFVIGGAAAYREALDMPQCVRVFLTRVGVDMECDVFFPALDDSLFQVVHMSQTQAHEGLPYDFVVYERHEDNKDNGDTNTLHKRRRLLHDHLATLSAAGGAEKFLHEEYQYLNLIHDIIDHGVSMSDRTGTGTRSVFGTMMRFNLQNSFPLLTTKRVFFRGVVEELLWFIRGDTNSNHLADKGIKIWDGNGSREFLDKRGLTHREVGDLGPVYGFQWRHFGAKYVDMHTDYTGKGVDQLAECIKRLKEDPTDRRIIISAWNPTDLSLMALPPCHMFCQFYVANGELSCLMYQRSCDMGLGVPFNIASYSLLTLMMAQVCGLKPGQFIHQMGNTHVYLNHIEPLQTQLQRTPRPFPVLKINSAIKDIDGFQASDFELVGYNPHGKIAMDMAV